MFYTLGDRGGAFAIKEPGAAPKTLPLPDGMVTDITDIQNLIVNSVNGDIAVLCSGRGRPLWVEFFEGKGLAKKGELDLVRRGGSAEIQFGVDGKTIFYTVGGRSPEVIRYEDHFTNR